MGRYKGGAPGPGRPKAAPEARKMYGKTTMSFNLIEISVLNRLLRTPWWRKQLRQSGCCKCPKKEAKCQQVHHLFRYLASGCLEHVLVGIRHEIVDISRQLAGAPASIDLRKLSERLSEVAEGLPAEVLGPDPSDGLDFSVQRSQRAELKELRKVESMNDEQLDEMEVRLRAQQCYLLLQHQQLNAQMQIHSQAQAQQAQELTQVQMQVQAGSQVLAPSPLAQATVPAPAPVQQLLQSQRSQEPHMLQHLGMEVPQPQPCAAALSANVTPPLPLSTAEQLPASPLCSSQYFDVSLTSPPALQGTPELNVGTAAAAPPPPLPSPLEVQLLDGVASGSFMDLSPADLAMLSAMKGRSELQQCCPTALDEFLPRPLGAATALVPCCGVPGTIPPVQAWVDPAQVSTPPCLHPGLAPQDDVLCTQRWLRAPGPGQCGS